MGRIQVYVERLCMVQLLTSDIALDKVVGIDFHVTDSRLRKGVRGKQLYFVVYTIRIGDES